MRVAGVFFIDLFKSLYESLKFWMNEYQKRPYQELSLGID